MTDTVRRKNLRHPFEGIRDFILPKDLVKGRSDAEVVKMTNAIYYSDRWEGYSCPKFHRRRVNRAERRVIKNEIRLAITNDSFDGFVNVHLHVPYWD